MSKLFSRLAGVAAAGAIFLSIGVASAAANVNTYSEPNGDVVTIHTSNVSAPVGTTTTVPVTVSLTGSHPMSFGLEKVLNTLYDIPDSQFDGLSIAKYGCSTTLWPGQSCLSTIAFTPNFVGTHNEAYVAASEYGPLLGRFTATGRPVYVPLAPSSGLLAP